jgi:limonene-1,2-epoxide hydrolase
MTATDPGTVVRDFLKAWEARDLDAIMDYFADDAEYVNVPLDPAIGHAAIRELIGGLLVALTHIAVDIRHQLTDGGIVMNERIDTVHTSTGKDVPLHVMGIFEIRDGKIVKWRDYFDSTGLTAAFAPD